MVVSILVVVSVILVAFIIFQIAQTGDLIAVLKGGGEGEVSEETNRFAGLFFLAFLILGLVGVYWSVRAYQHLFLPEAASLHGKGLDSMFNITLFFTGIVFIITHIALFVFAFKYRGRRKHEAYYYPHNNKLELVWTVVPSIVLTVLVILGIKAWLKTTGPAPEDAMVIEVTGQQFNWNVRYPGKDGTLGKREFEEMSLENPMGIVWSDQNSHDDFMPTEIHLITNQPVHFKLGSKDVIHSFFLPHFRVKMDCVPGIPTQFSFTPTISTTEMRQKTGNDNFDYFVACAELCGQAHWNMKMKVVVGSEEEFKQWASEQKPVYELLKANESSEKNKPEQDKAQLQPDGEKENSAISAL